MSTITLPAGPPRLVRTTQDTFANFAARLGIGADNLLSQGKYNYNPITRLRPMLEIMYRSSSIVGAAVDCVAEDMFRAGVELKGVSLEDQEQLQRALRTRGVWTGLENTAKWARLYGGAIGVMMIDGQNVSTPLVPESIRKGQFKGILPIDRWFLDPSEGPTVTDFGPDFGLPEFYKVIVGAPAFAGQRIHYTRVVRMVGIELPHYQSVTENGWGQSIVERLYDRLVAFDSATAGAAQMSYKAHLRVLKIEKLRELIAAGGKAIEAVTAQVDMIRRFQSNEGLTMLDSSDEFEAYTYAFTGLNDLLMSLGQQVAGALQIPLTRLFGQAPAGMNATGESDIRSYYDTVDVQRESRLRRPLGRILDVTHRSELGRAPAPEFDFNFEPLWQLDDNERADIAGKIASAVNTVEGSGIITRATALRELRQSADTTGIFGHITDEEIEEAEAEPPPVPEGHAIDADGNVVPQRSLTEKDQQREDRNAQNDNALSQKTADASAVAPLYVHRKVVLPEELADWCERNGFRLDPDPHVTVAYSTKPVDWFKAGEAPSRHVTIPSGGPRKLARLGDALVLLLHSRELDERWRDFRRAGASWDFEEYNPHVTLSYSAPNLDVDAVAPFQGEIRLGPENFEPIQETGE